MGTFMHSSVFKACCLEVQLVTCFVFLSLQVSEAPGPKKSWDVRCVVIGVLILLIMVAGAAAAVIAHRFKGNIKQIVLLIVKQKAVKYLIAF